MRLTHGDRSVELSARLDTGAADCIFDYSYADILGLTNPGFQREYRTVAGSFKAIGHEITIATMGLEWTAVVFFHAMGNPAHAFVGRRGWLDRVRIGIVHYEQKLLLGQYGI
ncbi:MAG TPA: hypothetical protein VKB79_19295 [Bryobacteraceae bacterium]|nr:hypothetical protein [Bryobacteraceae bacterium]